MKNKFLLITLFTILFLPALFSGCTDSASLELQRQQVVFDDNTTTTEDGRQIVVMDDDSLKVAESKIKSTAVRRAPEIGTNDDGSQTTTTFDGYGNKTDSRCFTNNSNLKCVVVETSFDGSTEITAYGKGGEIKKITDDKIKDVLNAPVSEIIGAAEFSGESQRADITKLMPSKKSQTNLKPLPSSEFPVFPKPVQTSPPEIAANNQPDSGNVSTETEDQ